MGKRLGMCSGHVYETRDEAERGQECCMAISDKEAKDDRWLYEQQRRNLAKCFFCFGCPASKSLLAGRSK